MNYIDRDALGKLQKSISYDDALHQGLSVCWSGLRDPIACSLLGGGIPTQNSGYGDTRLCPS